MQKRIASVTVLVIIAVGAFIFLQPEPSPCRQIRAACEAQGFKRGRTPAERRAFQESCVRPLMEGQPVGNAKVQKDVVAACKERQSKRRGNRGGKPDGRPSRDSKELQESDEEA